MSKLTHKKISIEAAENEIDTLFRDIADTMNLPPIDLDNLGDFYGKKKISLQGVSDIAGGSIPVMAAYEEKSSETSWGETKQIDFSYSGDKGSLNVSCRFDPDDSECFASGSSQLLNAIDDAP